MTEIPGWTVEEGNWAVARLGPSDPLPEWARAGAFSSITRTRDELSIVCAESSVPEGVRAERGWAMVKLAGPFPFDAIGVLQAFLSPLARAGISVFAVSTFDTDYVLMKRTDLERAIDVLATAGRVR
ncbi:MAG TPA: ACT domain-containing protein [Thermoanaerobaculia bacterium]|nr:ACT domain-containing protein [Thermoanaerobaculia bacterium]